MNVPEDIHAIDDKGQPTRILIVRVGAMGDVLHAMAAVAALRRARPAWQIDWAIEPRWADLLTGGPLVQSVIPVNTREWKRRPLSLATARDLLALRHRLRAARYSLCVDLQGSIRSATIGWMAAAARFAGPSEPAEGPAIHLYSHPVPTHTIHVIDRACEILGQATGFAPEAPLRAQPTGRAWMLPLNPQAETWAEHFLGRLQPPRGTTRRGFVVMAPTSGWGAKQWPAEHFGQVAARLARAGWIVLANADATGGPIAQAVAQASGGAAVPLQCSIAELISVLRRASLFLGGDTGPMHLADALGVPLVTLFGPTDPLRTGPYDGLQSARVLRHPASRTDHRRHPQSEAGLARITVEEVTQAAFELLTDVERSA